MSTPYRSFGLALLGALGLLPTACDGEPSDCSVDQPFLLDGQATGFSRCDGVGFHRPQALSCPVLVPRAQTACSGNTTAECREDTDCPGANAFCADTARDFSGPLCECSVGCASDADCASGEICLCGDPVGGCVTAECTTDADCGAGLRCLATVSDTDDRRFFFGCQTEGDECLSQFDCGDEEACLHDGEERFCKDVSSDDDGGPVEGRPFLVDGRARTAPRARRGDWGGAVSTPSLPATAAERLVLSHHWSRAALMEHASVAAFARFALQLLSLGAPPELLEETQQAIADELRHARICFTFASAYAGCAIGPGPIDMTRAVEGEDAATIVRLTFREGCVGETVAALEAIEAARGCRDAAVAVALETIAADELRHAALAWRFVQWALERDASFETLVRAELAAALRPVLAAADDDDRVEHGVLGSRSRARIRNRTVAEVVAPVALALLEARSGRARSA